MLDEDAYIESLRLVPASGNLGGGRPFRGPECGIFLGIFLSTWKLLLFRVRCFASLSSIQRIFHAFACLSLDVELEWLDEAWAGKLVSCAHVEESPGALFV
jgi:hypothetical protein